MHSTRAMALILITLSSKEFREVWSVTDELPLQSEVSVDLIVRKYFAY